MNKFLKLWNDFWFSKYDPLPASLFRISLGVLMFVFYIANFPSWERFYAMDGMSSLSQADLLTKNWWSIFSYTEGVIPIKAYWWIGTISTITFTIGFQTRLSTIILYVIQTSMNNRDWFVVNGEDHIFRMVLFYSMFAPLNYYFSIDNLLKKKRELPTIWAIRAMQINIAMIYFVNVPNKLGDDFAWINGEAIYWTMVNNMWGSRLPHPEIFAMWDCLLSKIASYGTLLVEGLFPYLVWFKSTKFYVLIPLTLLHIGIAFVIPNVTFFTLSMVCAFWVFVPPEVVRKIINKLLPQKFVASYI